MNHQYNSDFQDGARTVDPFADFDPSLDDFDRSLLAEQNSQGHNPESQRRWERGPMPTPSSTIFKPPFRTPPRQVFHDHSQLVPVLSSKSSSPLISFSSPTISAARKKVEGVVATTHQFEEYQDSGSETFDLVKPNKRMGQAKPLMPQAQARNRCPVIQGIELVPTSVLPDQLRAVFPFKLFNAVQSKCFLTTFKSNDNVVISAPTGSGKTAVMELAICRLAVEHKSSDFKVIYQAPTKALCAERYRDWQTKFTVLNLKCSELTGDTDNVDVRSVQGADIIITTPEKWDSITRKWKDHAKLMQLVRLFLVDEVHILRESRGATLEAVVSRMKSVVAEIRFIALSATVPNSEDIAVWLGKYSNQQDLPAFREVFGESFRPVELKKYVRGFEAKSNDFAFEAMLTKQLPGIIFEYGLGKPVIIFCSTRRACASTAKMLAESGGEPRSNQARLWRRPDRSISLQSSELKSVVQAGVAFHHGGLSASDRRTIEDCFLQGQIGIICSTSTLAVGVNLPCYLVILKGTTHWTDHGLKEYGDLEVMQMLGRAGRPQFEKSACAVILTQSHKVARYETMVSGEELLESNLHLNLIEHLNAEVGLGTVCDLKTAKQWLYSSFLHVRLSRNPGHYQFKEDVEHRTEDELLERLCQKDLKVLQEADLIQGSDILRSTPYGDTMARYYVSFETMKSFMSLPPKAKLSELASTSMMLDRPTLTTSTKLSVLSQACEFKEIRFASGEKSFYKEINKAPEIKFPVKVDVALPAHKISLLIQAELGSVTLPEQEQYKKHMQQHRIDRGMACNHANRLIRCIIDCQILREDSVSTRNALELGRCLAAHVWDNTASQLRQVEGLGEVAVRRLASRSINSIETLLNSEPSRIELVLAKNPPFGQQLLKKLEDFPSLRVSIKGTHRDLRAGKKAVVKMVAEIGFLNEKVPRFFKKKPVFVCCLTETSDGRLIDFRKFKADHLQKHEKFHLSVDLIKPTSHIRCFVMCDEIAGTSKYAELDLSTIPSSIYIGAELFAVNTEQDADSQLQKKHNSDKWGDDFDDGGINDDDLLALVDSEDAVEVVEDIDDLLNKPSSRYNDSTVQNDHDLLHLVDQRDGDIGGSTVFRAPVRLDNGRWTCQHDCVEKNKSCKHKCCREGVAKPKRRLKPTPLSKEKSKNQTKITDMTGSKPQAYIGAAEIQNFTTLHPSVTKAGTRPAPDQFGEDARDLRHKRLKIIEADCEDQAPDCKKVRMSHAHQQGSGGVDLFSSLDMKSPTGDQPDHSRVLDTQVELDDSNHFTVNESASSSRRNTQSDAIEDTTSDPLLGINDIVENSSSLVNPAVEREELKSPSQPTPVATIGHFRKNVSATPMSNNDDLTLETVRHNKELPILDSNWIVENHTGDVTDATNFDVSAMLVSASSPTGSNGVTCDKLQVDGTEGTVQHDVTRESTSKRNQTLYNEDQRKKWEGIDTWLYEEFHEYVELV